MERTTDTAAASHEKKKPRNIILKKLTACSIEQQLSVREIRNQAGVRTSMYTEHEIGIEEHLNWIDKLRTDDRQIVFAILTEQDDPIGVVSLNAYDRIHKKSDWAFYLAENERGGLGAALEFNIIEYAFKSLEIEKLNCEVIETNGAVVKLHKKFNFKEEGFRRENIEKNGKRIGVYFLGLTKTDWLAKQAEIFENYKAVISKFSIRIEQPAD